MKQTLRTALANAPDDIAAAQRLRYDVFVDELGADGPLVDHAARREGDRFDPFASHLLLRDTARPPGDQVVGTYRFMTSEQAKAAGGFYSAYAYDLAPLTQSGLTLMELGRSCLHKDYRGGAGMLHLWAGLAAEVAARDTDLLFGVASFHGTDVQALAQPLSFLHHNHAAPADLRVTANGPTAIRMDLLPPEAIDRVAAVKALPALIKAYLRLGACVGHGAFVDYDFNTVDVFVLLQRDAINAMQKKIYADGVRRG